MTYDEYEINTKMNGSWIYQGKKNSILVGESISACGMKR